ncbi:nuclear transport factor 2 family protein [Sphingobium tyrosinilyticum]|uniref:Nuclear transport factor 2 family protein n=1 Tax=Sphingobium tyrosinilyticum TaxID=2715436 RepID=A0ABV9F4B7_9SPHN
MRQIFSKCHLEVISIVADSDDGVLESALALTSAKDGSILRARTLWFLGFKNGRIIKEHDYSFVLKD